MAVHDGPLFPSCDVPIEFPVTPPQTPQARLNDFLRKEIESSGIPFVQLAADLSKLKVPLPKVPWWAEVPLKKAACRCG